MLVVSLVRKAGFDSQTKTYLSLCSLLIAVIQNHTTGSRVKTGTRFLLGMFKGCWVHVFVSILEYKRPPYAGTFYRIPSRQINWWKLTEALRSSKAIVSGDWNGCHIEVTSMMHVTWSPLLLRMSPLSLFLLQKWCIWLKEQNCQTVWQNIQNWGSYKYAWTGFGRLT